MPREKSPPLFLGGSVSFFFCDLMFLISFSSPFPFGRSPADSAVANILWREEGNAFQFSERLRVLVNEDMWQTGDACHAVQNNHKVVFSPAELAFLLACPRCFIPSLVCFVICFSDHLGRKHLHTSRDFIHFANNTTDPVWGLQEKQLCGFQR